MRVLTAADVPGRNGFGIYPHIKDQPALARNVVRFRGETVLALGRAGVPILGYHWMPTRVWRTSKTAPGRGTTVSAFDLDQVAGSKRPFTGAEQE